MTETSPEWELGARSLMQHLAAELYADLRVQPLSAVLLLFRVLPPNPRAPAIDVLFSADEAIIFAGEASRFELPGLPEGQSEIRAVVQAVAQGGLLERIRGRRVQGALSLEDGTVLRSDIWDAQRPSQRSRTISYEPFGVVER